MSTNPKAVPTSWKESDPKAIEFLATLRAKTLQGKVVWKKLAKDAGFYTTLPNNILAYFSSTTVPPFEWNNFAVQLGGKPIYHISKTISDLLLMMAPDVTDPIQREAHELFRVVLSKQSNPLDQALDSLKQI